MAKNAGKKTGKKALDSKKNSRQRGDRFKSDDDALQQLEEIENAQRFKRRHGRGNDIESTEKSRQRANNRLKNLDINDLGDFE